MEESLEHNNLLGQSGLVLDGSETVSPSQGGVSCPFAVYHRKRMNKILKQTHLGRGLGWGVFG